jgi:membrane protease YdiL (CAAX protease family)
MFLLLAGYVLWAGHSGKAATSAAPALPSAPLALFLATGWQMLLFAAVFAGAWLAGRPSLPELYCVQKIQILTLVFGFAWSLVLRAGILVIALLVAGISMLLHSGIGADSLQQLRPKIENLFDPKALSNPNFVLLCTTWVSFVVAGLREELWRAGVIASLRALFPAEWPGRRWEWLAVAIAAGIFGLGHLTQGWGAVALTGLLGLGLGGIMVLRRSLPEAVLAHGFFDALTFGALALLSNKALLRNLVSDPELLRQLDQILGR